MSQRSHTRQHDEELGNSSKDGAQRWVASIDEGPEGRDWLLEIDSPYLYLTLQLGDLSALQRAIDLLELALTENGPGSKHVFAIDRDDITLGRFGDAEVHLLRDVEDFPRCFILVQMNSECVLRITVDSGGVRAFAEALSQALADHPGIEKTAKRSWDYPLIGGSHHGLAGSFPEEIRPGSEVQIPMRAPGPPTDEERPDPEGRTELYRLESDGKLYFINAFLKGGQRITPPGVREPSRIINGVKYYDYRFVGGSHDGSNMSVPEDCEEGLFLTVAMRGEHGPLPGGKQEVYRLEADGRFHYQHAIMKSGKLVGPLPKPPGAEDAQPE